MQDDEIFYLSAFTKGEMIFLAFINLRVTLTPNLRVTLTLTYESYGTKILNLDNANDYKN